MSKKEIIDDKYYRESWFYEGLLKSDEKARIGELRMIDGEIYFCTDVYAEGWLFKTYSTSWEKYNKFIPKGATK